MLARVGHSASGRLLGPSFPTRSIMSLYGDSSAAGGESVRRASKQRPKWHRISDYWATMNSLLLVSWRSAREGSSGWCSFYLSV